VLRVVERQRESDAARRLRRDGTRPDGPWVLEVFGGANASNNNKLALDAKSLASDVGPGASPESIVGSNTMSAAPTEFRSRCTAREARSLEMRRRSSPLDGGPPLIRSR